MNYNNSKSLVAIPQQHISSRDVATMPDPAQLSELGRMFSASGMFSDVRDAAQAAVKIQAGRELGLPPVQAMTCLHLIKGRVTMSANLMAAMLKKAGYSWRLEWRTDPLACVLHMRDHGGVELGESVFSIEDARAAGLLGNETWKKFTRNMLFARAVSNAARWFAPEVLLGVYTPEELEDPPDSHAHVVATSSHAAHAVATPPIPCDDDEQRRKNIRLLHSVAARVAPPRADVHEVARIILGVNSIGDAPASAIATIPSLEANVDAQVGGIARQMCEQLQGAGSLAALSAMWRAIFEQWAYLNPRERVELWSCKETMKESLSMDLSAVEE